MGKCLLNKKNVFVLQNMSIIFMLIITITVNAQWVQMNNLKPDNILSFAVSGSNVFAGTDAGIYLSTNNGESWSDVMDKPYVPCLIFNNSNIFAGTNGYGIYLSKNNGISWTSVDNGLPYQTFLVSLAVSGKNIFAATLLDGVYLSTNNGTSWTAVNNGLLFTTNYFFSNYTLAIVGNNILTGTDAGVYISTNNGTNWQTSNKGLPDQTNVLSLAVDNNKIFAGTIDVGVYLSTDDGKSWNAANKGLPKADVNSLLINGNNIFAGTNAGVYLSTNNGTNWTAINYGLTNISIQSLAISGSYILAGTEGGGGWRRPLSEVITSVVKQVKDIPTKYSLSQNYPNPFNPSTEITYSIPKSGHVTLKVFDMLGREVATLVNEQRKAGKYEVTFDATDLSSGVFFYQLRAGSFSQTKKLVLLR